MAHAERFLLGYDRLTEPPGYYLDEAEASISAAFNVALENPDRYHLVQDARDQLDKWMRSMKGRL
jgi:hypothetical protein